MKIEVRKGGLPLTRVRRTEVERRLALALARFADLVENVGVSFTRADAGCLCAIEVRLRRRTLRAQDTDPDLVSALDSASGRIARSVARARDRERAWDGNH